MKKIIRISAAAGTIGALVVVGAVPALANVERRGMCSASSTWEVDAEREDNFIEVDFEVDTPTPDQDWTLTVRQNGKRIFSDTRPATRDFEDRLADVDWSVTTRDTAGTRDRFQLIATNQVTKERCESTVRV